MAEMSPVKRALRRIEELEREVASARQFAPIAIIGMACRLPGGVKSPEDFWKLLCEGRDAVGGAPAGRWPAGAEIPQGGFLTFPIDEFDARLFGISPLEAIALDPAHRLLLETSWEAWENSGIAIDSLKGSRTGVWIGISASDYTQAHIRSGDPSRIGPYDVTGSIGSTAAGRLSYFYDLRGPSLAVDTACSSSLVAIDLACACLREQACDMALAGGVSLMLSPEVGICFSKMQALAPDGRSKAFDAAADGFGRGEGCGILVMERLGDAQRNGHPVLAVVRSSAVNQDGRSNGLTAPSVQAQKDLLGMALERGGLRAADIGYLEAHGTGTPLGDPIEMEAVAEVLGQGRMEPLWVGSVKTNIGHLEAAAGVAGVIKTVLTLRHGQIPRHLHLKQPSPHIPWPELPMRIPLALSEWAAGTAPRRAGVSSFGFSGTNAHLILEEAGAARPLEAAAVDGPSLLCLSARDEAALERVAGLALEFFRANPQISLEEACRAFRTGRHHLGERMSICAASPEDLRSSLETGARVIRGRAQARPRVVFAFTGQGAQYAGMGRELYQSEPVFRAAFDRCAAVFDGELPAPLGRFVFEGLREGQLGIDETRVAQPALFALGFALAELLASWGVRPEAVFGHSIGEYVAAVLAGVFSLEDACGLVAARGALMQSLLRHGAMAAVFAGAGQVNDSLKPYAGRLEIAAFNGPAGIAVSGERDALDALLVDLEARGIRGKRLTVSHAFHSHLMDPVLPEFRRRVAGCARHAPRLALYSNLTGDAKADFTSPDYWAEHLRRSVQFEKCARAAAGQGSLFVEIGAHPVLSALGKQIDPAAPWIPTLRRDRPDRKQLLETLGHLYVRGASLDWNALGKPAAHVRLPNYPFERQRFWALSHTAAEQPVAPTQQIETKPAILQRILRELAIIVRDNAGLDDVDPKANLLDLGIDSLMLMTTRQQIADRYGVEIPVSHFFDELPSLDKIAAHLERTAAPARLGVEAPPASPAPPACSLPTKPAAAAPPVRIPEADLPPGSGIEAIMAQQMQTMQQLMAAQLETLRRMNGASQPEVSTPPIAAAPPAAPPRAFDLKNGIPLPPSGNSETQPTPVTPELFVPYKPIRSEDDPDLDLRKRQHLDDLTGRYVGATAQSKELVQQYRPVFANNRHIAGFRPAWKEMVYQITAKSAEGSRIHAAGGQEFIDMTMGFGVHLFGHKPPFLQEALRGALEKGAPLGPINELAGPAAEKFCRMTGMERVAFYNTGSEAVMTALRIARTVTQRNRIALFEGSYHGTFDGVLALRREKDGLLYTVPGSPGTTPGMTEDVLVLRYDDPQSLELIERHGSELAAVLTEPVQSRRPDVRPKKFLEELRQLTRRSGTALIFDEMVSGFRCHPGGAQAYFGVRADLATYGKVIGGGMPIGLVAGSAEYMDAVDGGFWRFGDATYPRKRNTFVAGTFCHHPLSLAAMTAVLDRLTADGPALQENLNRRTAAFCERLNAYFTENEVPIRVAHFASLLRFFLRGDLELLFYHLIARGIYVWEGRNCFLSTAHSDADLERVTQAVMESIEDLRKGGYLPPRRGTPAAPAPRSSAPPAPMAVTAAHAPAAAAAHTAAMEFSLFYFSSSSQAEHSGYRLLIEGAKYADQHGYAAVWTPERHFHDFGGLYPNPAITCAALASVTARIRLRAGSTVILLHDPVRFAENWAMVDNLSGGRVDLALALGWNSNDFIFAPDLYEDRARLLPEHLKRVRSLWRGEAEPRTGGRGESIAVHAYPRPVQSEIPIWFTAAGNPETFKLAGQHGANVLTYLEGQTLPELTAKIAVYREARRAHGHAGPGHVTLMLHTFLGSDRGDVLRRVDQPLREYLKSSFFLRTQFANSLGVHIDKLSDADLAPILDRAVDRYIRTCSLIGTPESCREMVENAAAAGVNEIGCLIDFGIPFDEAMRGLESLTELKNAFQQPAPKSEPALPLTEEQKQLWYLCQQSKEASLAYNEMVLLRLTGPLAIDKLEEAINLVAARHEALRTVSIGESGQVFADLVYVPVETVDFRGMAAENRPAQVASWLAREAARAFDFERGPLFRATLLATADVEHLLLFSAHHIASNGWSISLALEETAALYTALVRGHRPELPAAVPFGRYLEWEKQQEEKAAAADLRYWSRQLAVAMPAFELPAGKPRGPLPTWRGERRNAAIQGEELRGLRAAARQNGTTLFMVLLGGWATLLHRLTGADQVAVWIPVSRQAAMGAHVLAGQCTRMFPVIVDFDEAATPSALLSRVKRALLEVYEHQNISLGRTYQGHTALALPPAAAMFNLDRAPGLPKFEGVAVAMETAPIASAKYEFSLNALEMGGRLILDFDYRADLFDAQTMDAWVSGFQAILHELSAGGDTPLGLIPLPAGAVEASAPAAEESVLDAFERNARLAPDRLAIASGKRITYGELAERSGRMAAALAAHGVQPGDGVGLDPGDPLEAITVRLALMKLGASCLEPDPRSVVSMLNLCDHAALLLARGPAVRMAPHDNVLDLDGLWRSLENYEPLASRPSEPDALAAVFHLDESSFACTHATLAGQAAAARELFGIREGDRIAVCGSVGVETVFAALSAGATIEPQDEPALEGVDIAILPAHMAKHPSLTSGAPRLLAFTDGPLPQSAALRFRNGPEVIGICRPDGVPLLAAAGMAGGAGSDRRGVWTGSVYLPGAAVDGSGEPVAEGVIGRWQLAGARGACVTNTRVQLQHGRLLWMTTLAGEVETALREITQDAAVFAILDDRDQAPRLEAYIVPSVGVTIAGVRAALAAVLPAALMPRTFAELPAIPMGLRRNPWALAELCGPANTGLEYTAPRDENERRMCAIWEEILERRPVGIHDNFADLGGQSLHAARLALRVQQDFGAAVTLAGLLSAPTPAALCRTIGSGISAPGFPEIPVLSAQPDYESSRAQHRMWAMAQVQSDHVGYNIPVAALLEGPLQLEALRAAFGDLALRHETLRTCFVERDGEPRQAIGEPSVSLDYSEVAAADERAAVIGAASALAALPFDLRAAPLWRARVLRFAKDRYGLAMAFHHIVTDGWSIEVCSRDLGALYLARISKASAPAPLALQYRDYAAWDNGRTAADTQSLAWWGERLADLERIELPCDFPRSAAGPGAATLRQPLGAELSRQLDGFCQARQITRFMGLAAATAGFVHRLTGARDIALGTPVARRDHPLLQEQVGLYVNTIVLREQVGERETFAGLVQRMRQTSMDSMAHGATPFDRVVDRIGAPRDWNRSPLFDVMLTLEENPRVARQWGDARLTAVDVPPAASLFDLNFRFQESGKEMVLSLDYRTGLFDPGRSELWAGRFVSFLRAALAYPEQTISELDMRCDAEKAVRKRRPRVEVRF